MSMLQKQTAAASPALRRVVRQIDQISTLPEVAARAIEQAGDPNLDADALKQLLQSDPALAARLWRQVGSSPRPVRNRIIDLDQAIAYLGTRQIRELAITSRVSDCFRSDESIRSYRRGELWRHSVAVAICARMIARRLKLANPEGIFLAGLLHDLGIILEDQYLHDPFADAIHSLEEGRTLAEAERNHLGFDHTALGEQMGMLWGFPEPVVIAIRYHHMSVRYRGDHIQTVRCIEVANLISTLTGISSVGLNLVKFSGPAFNGLGLAREDVAGLIEDLAQELARHADLFPRQPTSTA